MVKKCLKVLATIGFLFCFSFICVGYANLVDELVIEGNATAMTDVWELLTKEQVSGSVMEEVEEVTIEVAAGVHIGYGSSTEKATQAAFRNDENMKNSFPLYKIRDLEKDGLPEYFAEIDASMLLSTEDDTSVLICVIPGYKNNNDEQLYINTENTEGWRADDYDNKLKDCDFEFESTGKYYLVIYNVDLENEDRDTSGNWKMCMEEELIEELKGVY